MTSINTIYWDLGGVVVTDNVQPGCEALGIPYVDSAERRAAWKQCRLGAITLDKFCAEVVRGTDIAAHTYRELATNHIKEQPNGALPLIKELHRRGVRQGVLSNHTKEWAQQIRRNYSLDGRISPDKIIISAEVKLDKDDPAIFALAIERAGCSPSEILFFDDRQKNVDVAKQSGINAYLFTNATCAISVLESYGVLRSGEFVIQPKPHTVYATKDTAKDRR